MSWTNRLSWLHIIEMQTNTSVPLMFNPKGEEEEEGKGKKNLSMNILFHSLDDTYLLKHTYHNPCNAN